MPDPRPRRLGRSRLLPRCPARPPPSAGPRWRASPASWPGSSGLAALILARDERPRPDGASAPRGAVLAAFLPPRVRRDGGGARGQDPAPRRQPDRRPRPGRAAAALVLRRQAALLLAGAVAASSPGSGSPLPPLAVDAYPTTYLRSTVPYQAASIASGIDLYGAHCATCHGRGRRGRRPRRRGPAPPPRRPHRAAYRPAHRGRSLLVAHPRHPRRGMPPFGNMLSEDDRWDVINFLRALSAGAAGARPHPAHRARPRLARRARLHVRDRAVPGAQPQGAARAARGAARPVHAARLRRAHARARRRVRRAAVPRRRDHRGADERGARHPGAPRRRPARPLPRRHRRRRGHRARVRAVQAHPRPAAFGPSRRRPRTWSS